MAKIYPKPTHPLFVDLTGVIFGRLVVLAFRGRVKTGDGKNFRWLVRCNPMLGGCGKQRIVRASDLISGRTQSCGCMRLQHVTRHGLSKHCLYPIFRQMHARCYNPKNIGYSRYGARGIYVAAEWHGVSGLNAFIAWCGIHPRGSETLERIDNDGPYSPDNCCWASRREQANNTRKVTMLTYEGKTQSLHAWARELNLPVTTLFNRLHLLGWPINRAF